MHKEENYPELHSEAAGWRVDPSCEADRLSTTPIMMSDPVETAHYIDRIAQRSAGWFRSY